jgi:hypothetical protein
MGREKCKHDLGRKKIVKKTSWKTSTRWIIVKWVVNIEHVEACIQFIWLTAETWLL